MFGKRKLEEQLKQNGQRATAKILTATQGRFAVTHGNPELVANTELTWHLTLEVMPDDAAAFEAELTDRWPQLAGPGIGAMIGVIYDPADHSKLVIDHSAAAAKEANARVAESVIEEGMRDHGASAEAAAKVGADAYLARTGAPGTGTVTAVHDTGVTGERDSHELEVTLDVTPDDGSAGYTAILVQLVGPMAMSRFEVGRPAASGSGPEGSNARRPVAAALATFKRYAARQRSRPQPILTGRQRGDARNQRQVLFRARPGALAL